MRRAVQMWAGRVSYAGHVVRVYVGGAARARRVRRAPRVLPLPAPGAGRGGGVGEGSV